MTGVLLIDKPSCISSYDVIRHIKRIVPKGTKIGHSGTLDPLASGLLVVLIGKATKLQNFFLCAQKSYSGDILFGKSTDSYDILGNIEQEASFDEDQISSNIPKIIETFTGKQSQVPPNFSALKVNGKKAYEKARSGEKFKLDPREIEIFNLQLNLNKDALLEFKVTCSKGTYIRSLAKDIGEFLSIPACLKSLRRTSSGDLSIENSIQLDALDENTFKDSLLKLSEVLVDFSKIKISENIAKELSLGRQQIILQIDELNKLDSQYCFLIFNDREFALLENSTKGWKIFCLLN